MGRGPGSLPVMIDRFREVLAARRPGRLLLATVAAPPAPAEVLWRADATAPAALWHPQGGVELAGLGEAVVLAPSGGDRFRLLAAELAELWQGADRMVEPDAPSHPPAVVGGAAFVPGAAAGSLWRPFGDLRFVLPRWTYQRDGNGASLTLAVMAEESDTAARDHLASLGAIHRALAGAQPAPPRVAGEVALRELGLATWSRQVEAIRGAIATGELRKVVLVRHGEAETAAMPEAAEMLARLRVEGDEVFRFGFRIGGRVFLGASPELLVARRGRELTSEALAASLPRDCAGGEDADARHAADLAADPKQREEHEIVVAAVRERLAPLCDSLEAPAEPSVRFLRRLVHLSTPFRGTLASPVALAEIVGRLHPTPAVGGEPTDAALAWLAKHESEPRGWFAGPVGRIDISDDGELAVALRCAFIDGKSAHVWAGAGIVAGSDAAAEYEETAVKALSCLLALGLVR